MIDEKKLSEFAEDMIKAYNNNSILKKVSEVIPYSEANSGLAFFQIGRRTLLPKDFFEVEDNVDNSFLAQDFAKSVVLGEIDFIIEKLTDMAKNGKIPLLKINEFKFHEIANAMSKVDRPTNIFIPMNLSYYSEVNDWVSKKWGKYENGNSYIDFENCKVKVHWISKSVNYIIILNRKELKIVQKSFKDIKIPKELTKIQYPFKDGESLRLDFADSSKGIDNFDFYFRSVIALKNVNKESVAVIELPKIENKEEACQ